MRFPLEGYRSALLSRSLPVLVISALLSVLGAASLTGCGVGTLANSVPQVAQVIPAFSGTMMGGQSPIVNATIKIYATGSDGNCTAAGSVGACSAGDIGYGNGTLLQEATSKTGTTGQDTDANGSFSFAGGYFCPAGEFVYLVGSGGNPGSATNAANSNILLVAALGRCEDLYTQITGGYQGYTGSNIYLNEVTTVAAGYALGNFATVTNSGSPSTTQVLIGAPSTNNAPQNGSGISTGTTAAAAGLYHAFLNAANLANPFSTSVLATAPSTTTAGGTVPAALINSIANILANCVDTGDGGGGQCSNLPGGADTFTAVKMLAANPTLGGSGTAVSNLFNNVGLVGPFSPALTGPPNDFSIAINYTSGLVYPISGALDVNDNYYLGNQSSSAPSAAGSDTLVSFTSNGTKVSTITLATPKYTYGMSVDSLGNGYMANGSASSASQIGVFTFTASSGTVGSSITYKAANSGNFHAYATAVDKSNNVWVIGYGASATTNLLYASAAGAGSFGTGYAVQGATSTNIANPKQFGIAIDNSQNVWTAFSDNTTGGVINVLPYSGTAYGSVLTPSGTAFAGTPAIGITFGGIGTTAETAFISSYTTPDIQPFTATLTTGQVTAVSGGTATTVNGQISGSIYNTTDGAGTIWIADANSTSVINYNPTNTTAYRYKPCVVSSGTCSNGLAGKPYQVNVDSTGSMWVTDPGGPNVMQIIGSAAPTWPLLSLGKYGVSP